MVICNFSKASPESRLLADLPTERKTRKPKYTVRKTARSSTA
jgi:hypothetical protein